MPSGQDRLHGFLETLENAGLEPGPIEAGDFTAASGAQAMMRLLDSGRPIDALFVASDLMARAAVDVLRSRGTSVPEDIAVVGFDDSVMAVEGSPQLTTIRQDSVKQGQLMAQMLLDRLEGGDPARSIILPTELVIRESA